MHMDELIMHMDGSTMHMDESMMHMDESMMHMDESTMHGLVEYARKQGISALAALDVRCACEAQPIQVGLRGHHRISVVMLNVNSRLCREPKKEHGARMIHQVASANSQLSGEAQPEGHQPTNQSINRSMIDHSHPSVLGRSSGAHSGAHPDSQATKS